MQTKANKVVIVDTDIYIMYVQPSACRGCHLSCLVVREGGREGGREREREREHFITIKHLPYQREVASA